MAAPSLNLLLYKPSPPLPFPLLIPLFLPLTLYISSSLPLPLRLDLSLPPLPHTPHYSILICLLFDLVVALV